MKRALLLIDVQNDYFAGEKSELDDTPSALENIEKLLRYFRGKALPVIHVRHVNIRGGGFFPDGYGRFLIHKNLMPREGDYLVIKHAPNPFFETLLPGIIKDNSISELVICGRMSRMCADTTARACADFGVKAILIEDACAAKSLTQHGEEIHAAARDVFKASLSGAFANVMEASRFLSLSSMG